MKIPLYEFLCCLLRHHLGFLDGIRDHGPDFFQANRQIPHLVATLLRGHNQLTSPIYLILVLNGKMWCEHWNLPFWHRDIETTVGRGGLVPSEPFFVSQLRESSQLMPGGTEPPPWNSLGGKTGSLFPHHSLPSSDLWDNSAWSLRAFNMGWFHDEFPERSHFFSRRIFTHHSTRQTCTCRGICLSRHYRIYCQPLPTSFWMAEQAVF